MKNLIYLLIITLLTCACKSRPQVEDSFDPFFSTVKTDSTGTPVSVEKYEIFYGILTPVEISAIFNRLNVPYETAALNPVSNGNKYLTSSQAAVNTGIYGVDFGYLNTLGSGKDMIEYMEAIRTLCNELGIPESYLTDPLRRIQKDMADQDTVINIMNKTYYKIEEHLRENGRESTAGLIVLGGWIEALYIASQLVYDPNDPDPEVVNKIAEQKYTLTSLLSFLKNYYDDPVVVYYTKKLKFLKNYFDSFDIYFEKGDLEIDTTKQVFRTSGSEMTVTIETLNNIRNYIRLLRNEMVTP